MGAQPHWFTFCSLLCTLTPTDVTRVHGPYPKGSRFYRVEGSAHTHTHVQWRHYSCCISNVCVSVAAHVGMSPARQKWCQEPLREKHVSGIHHCCAGSQMSPAPAACLPPFALPPLVNSSALEANTSSSQCWIVIVVLVSFGGFLSVVWVTKTKVLTWDSTCMLGGIEDKYCLPSTDTASSAGLNTPMAAGRKQSICSLSVASHTMFLMQTKSKTMKQKKWLFIFVYSPSGANKLIC